MKALRKWFGNESSEEENEISEEDDNWNEVDRVKKNNMKKKRLADKKTEIEKETLKKGDHILGMGPISFESG